MLKNDIIDLIDLLFMLDSDKNFSLSDLDVYKYKKMREKVIATVPDIITNHVDWKYC